MDILTIKKNNNKVELEATEGNVTYEGCLGMILDALKAFILIAKASNVDMTELGDYISNSIGEILLDVLGEDDKEPLDFTDAAIYYAQNLLLERAMEEGKTIEELMKEFNQEAAEHVAEAKEWAKSQLN